MACFVSAVDIPTADPYLANCADWQAADDPTKTDALGVAQTYFDARYSCACETPQENIDQAISYLACMQLQGKLYPSDDETRGQYVTREMVKAGSVESDTEWSVGVKVGASELKRIDDVLYPYCKRITANTVTLSRD